MTPIAEQVVGKQLDRVRRRTLSRQLGYTADELRLHPSMGQSAASSRSPSISPMPMGKQLVSKESSDGYPSHDERLKQLLEALAHSVEVTADMKQEAKALLDRKHGLHLKDKPVSLMSPSPDAPQPHDDSLPDAASPGLHNKSSSVWCTIRRRC